MKFVGAVKIKLSGLPAEKGGELRRATWNPGTFGNLKQGIVRRLLDDLGPRTRIVTGFYNESLTSQLAATMRPAALVDIDSDIYVSASGSHTVHSPTHRALWVRSVHC